jgi:aerobic carbon-monoxide dehydrogenase medium subunit
MSLRYVSPASLSEALSFLAEHGPDSVILAGGMSLVPILKRGLLTQKFIVNIKRIGETPLPTLDSTDGHLTISALVRHREIETSPIIAEHFPALCALEERLGSVQIRNHGTLAGNLCAAEPWTDPPCLLAALDARLTVVSKRGQRQVCTEDWIRGVGDTLRQPDELLHRIDLFVPRGNVGVGHARVAARQGLARPLACAAARVTLSEDGIVTAVRAFVGAVGPRPQRMTDVERMLVGSRVDDELSAEIEQSVPRNVEYLQDERCGAAYKTQVAGVLVRRAIADAFATAKVRAA